MRNFRILVADDHEVVRQGVCALLAEHDSWELCGMAVDGQDAVQQAKDLNPDLVILDLYMPHLNGIEAARQILHDDLNKRILILTVSQSDEIVQQLVARSDGMPVAVLPAGADLPAAIRAARSGWTGTGSPGRIAA